MNRYKARFVGIGVIQVNESHMSKCSALDLETIKHHDSYMGERIKTRIRLFRSKNGLYINADVNGSLNIMRKGVDGCLDGYPISKMLLSPLSVVV